MTWQEAGVIVGIAVIVLSNISTIIATRSANKKEWEKPMSEAKAQLSQEVGMVNAKARELETRLQMAVSALGEIRDLITEHTRTDLNSLERIDSKITELYKVMLRSARRMDDGE